MDEMMWQRRKRGAQTTDPFAGDDLFSAAAKDAARARELAAGQAAGEAQALTVTPAVLEQLVQMLKGMAANAGEYGVTVADLRTAAVKERLLPAEGEGRQLSFLGALPKRAGLVATDRIRRSHVDGAHGNRNTVWVHPDAAVRQGAA